MNHNITHTVSFTLKHVKGSEEAARFLNRATEMLAGIKGVNNFTAMEQVSAKCTYQYHFSLQFENQAAYDFYNNHPNHVRFVNDYWKKEVVDFQEQDFIRVDEI